MKSELDDQTEMPVVGCMPAMKKHTPSQTLAKRVRVLSASYTKRELAARVSEWLPPRTVEGWVQGRAVPPDWVCEFVLARWAAL